MAGLTLGYAVALLRAAPSRDLMRAFWARLRMRARRRSAAPSEAELARALEARPPRLFSAEEPAPLYARHFPAAAARLHAHARRILDGQAEIFGVWQSVAGVPRDPRATIEIARAGHLVELAAAARLHADLADAARAHLATRFDAWPRMEELPPLESAIRALHRLAAVELLGGVERFDRDTRRRFARAFLEEGAFLAANPEDGGACPANHLLGDWLGLYVCGLATGREDWRVRGAAGVAAEAERQVGSDGAHFEASTAYHRFAVELLFVAHRLGVGGLGQRLIGMLRFAEATLAPDGSHPGFGDGDDARLCPIVERAPGDSSYLAALGVLLGEPRPDRPAPEELIWWQGAAGVAAWSRASRAPVHETASFPTGGVHILRSPRLYVALRSGAYGQHGVGGHAHNDQLSLVVHAHGAPLIVDSGTGSYTFDPVVRDRFRGTAAHSTVIVDAEEQSPLYHERPFALPDAARAPQVMLCERGSWAALEGAHHGYRRLRARVIHHRRITLYRELDALLVEDELDGRGEVPVELRFHVAGRARLGASAAMRARAAELGGRLGPLDLERAVEIVGPRSRAALVPRPHSPLPRLASGWGAPRFGQIERRDLVGFAAVLSLPHAVAVVVLTMPRTEERHGPSISDTPPPAPGRTSGG
jgi:Heparinase II/III-like protein/Heparinase II/III N-terminus